jgi:hypothetical protein
MVVAPGFALRIATALNDKGVGSSCSNSNSNSNVGCLRV